MAPPKVSRPKVRQFLEDCEPGDVVTIAMGDVLVSASLAGEIRVILCELGTWRELSPGISVRRTEPVRKVHRVGAEYYTSLRSPGGVEVDPLRGEESDGLPSLFDTVAAPRA